MDQKQKQVIWFQPPPVEKKSESNEKSIQQYLVKCREYLSSYESLEGMTVEEKQKYDELCVKYIKTEMDEKTIQQYYERCKTYIAWEPNYLRVGDKVSLYMEPGSTTPIRMTVEEYNKWIKGQKGKDQKPQYLLFEKSKSLKQSYISDAESKMLKPSDLDELDKTFIKNPNEMEGCQKHELYGLHEYGGWNGFFRPDLFEVIHLIASVCPPDQLSQVKRIYVTTEAYPSDKFPDCFHGKMDMHKALTTCYIVR